MYVKIKTQFCHIFNDIRRKKIIFIEKIRGWDNSWVESMNIKLIQQCKSSFKILVLNMKKITLNKSLRCFQARKNPKNRIYLYMLLIHICKKLS